MALSTSGVSWVLQAARSSFNWANEVTPMMALAFCYHRWSVASTIIGVTSLAQFDEDLAAWSTQLSPEVLKAIDDIRWEMRDPAL